MDLIINQAYLWRVKKFILIHVFLKYKTYKKKVKKKKEKRKKKSFNQKEKKKKELYYVILN